MKIIELLNKIANDTLKDGTRVIIDNKSYCYNKEDRKLYIASNKNASRIIRTNELNMEVELADEQETQHNKIEEIDRDIAYKDTIANYFYNAKELILVDKINEIVRVLNNK